MRQISLLAALVFLLFTGGLPAQGKPAGPSLPGQAERLLLGGDPEGCARALAGFAARLEASKPEELQAYLKVSVKLFAADSPRSTLGEQIRALAAKHPQVRDPAFLLAVADELLAAKRNDWGRSVLMANVELSPRAVPALLRFVEVFIRTGHAREALEFYNRIAGPEAKSQVGQARVARAIAHRLAVQQPYFGENVADGLEDIGYRFRILDQDHTYEIDPPRGLFRSKQVYRLQNSGDQGVKVILFAIHPQLVLESVSLQDAEGREIPVAGWRLAAFDFIRNNGFPVFRLETGREIPAGGGLTFRAEVRLRPEYVVPEPVFWGELTVSPRASYAVLPFGGHDLIFGLNVASPFRVSLSCPRDCQACVPGDLVSSRTAGQRSVSTWASKEDGIPVFSCAPYRKLERSKGPIGLEYYLYPHETFPEELADRLFEAVELYNRTFGETGGKRFCIATSGPYHTDLESGENKGNCSYVTDDFLRKMLDRPEGRDEYLSVMFHEFFHNWNLFSLKWEGEGGEWFGEGSAAFVQAWAAERVLGREAGRRQREKAQTDLIVQKGLSCPKTLATVRKQGPPEYALIYHYGALVWEQLRQKLGDDVFFHGFGDFFRTCRNRQATLAQLLACWKPYTQVDVPGFLDPWIRCNQSIGLSIARVQTRPREGRFETSVTIDVAAGRNVELFTELGYRSSEKGGESLVRVHVDRSGPQTVTFVSDEAPRAIRLDPEARVPLCRRENTVWQAPPPDGCGPREGQDPA